MTRHDIAERLRTLRVMIEQQGNALLSEVEVPASLVLFDVMNALELPSDVQIYVLGAENALRLNQEYGIEWEEV